MCCLLPACCCTARKVRLLPAAARAAYVLMRHGLATLRYVLRRLGASHMRVCGGVRGCAPSVMARVAGWLAAGHASRAVHHLPGRAGCAGALQGDIGWRHRPGAQARARVIHICICTCACVHMLPRTSAAWPIDARASPACRARHTSPVGIQEAAGVEGLSRAKHAMKRAMDGWMWPPQIYASVVATLLSLMDGVTDRGQVVVIGATNRCGGVWHYACPGRAPDPNPTHHQCH